MSENVQAQSPEKSGAVAEIVEIIKTVVYALLIALFLRVLFFQPFTIPSASMEPNLYEGDYIVVSKFSYGYSRHSIPFSPPIFSGRLLGQPAHRGDIVVFKLPRDGHTDYVKRLIGLPGDRIQIKAGQIHLNGQPVKREALDNVREDSGYGFVRDVQRYRETLPDGTSFIINDFGPDGDLDNTEVFVVPENHYFMMGDNRDNSLDSRVAPSAGGVGYVPADNLVGKAQIILLSWHPGATIFKPWTWVMDARPSRFFHLLKMNARVAAVEELERRIGYSFHDRDLLERALTHASVGKGATKVLDNERLEFLGDRVLNLVVAEHIMGLRPELAEGELSKLMSRLVDFPTCARAARRAGLPEALRVDASATKVGVRDNDRVLGDACEALIAALYRDGGLDVARSFIEAFWDEAFETLDAPIKDAKTQLQEWAMAHGLPIPDYVVVAQDGVAHAPRFTIEVRLQGFTPETADASSKKAAEKLAAEQMLRRRMQDK